MKEQVFKKDTNKIKILTQTEQKEFSLKSKEDVAKDILDFVEENSIKNKKIVFKNRKHF
jgi:phosphopantothenoylcysteine decarboxylase/phosphopantothenate--cysteine ligase